MKFALTLGLALLFACNGSQPPAASDWSKMSSAQRQILLNRIADDCGVTRDFFRLDRDELRLQPHSDEPYEDVDCALGAVKQIVGLPKLGFVGNEAYVGNEQ